MVGVSCPMRCALRNGLYQGCLVAVSRRRAGVIGGEGMVWVSLCRCDWRGEHGVGAVVIGGVSVVWVALCHWDWLGGRPVASALPL